MLLHHISHRKTILTSLLLILLSLWFAGSLSPRTSQATNANSPLLAWGDNAYGQLGNNAINTTLPGIVSLPAGVSPTAISAGAIHSMAIGSDGKLYAWGNNNYGELGNGTNTSSNTPLVVNLPAGVSPTIIAAGGYHSLAVGSDGKLYAWGDNNVGQLGNGATSDSNSPVVVNLPAGVSPTAISAGSGHSLAIGNNGKLYAWGDNSYGQLGNGTTSNSATPLVVNLPAGVSPTAIAAGSAHNLVIGSDGKLYVWGDNDNGQLGNGTTTQSTTPLVVNLPAGVSPTIIAAGIIHSMAIGSDGKLYTWGNNNYGELGNGTTTQSTTPVVVNLPAGVSPTAITGGSAHSMAKGSDGKLYTWGNNNLGQLGNGTTSSTSTPGIINLPAGVSPTTITAGTNHNMVIGSDGKLYAWGYNDCGQLGNGTLPQSNSPVAVNLPAGVFPTVIAAGTNHTLAIGNDSKLYAWGNNNVGQLGDGTTIESTSPIVINLLAGVSPTAIAAGNDHSLAIGSDGKLYAWGDNSRGQLGNGTNVASNTPLVVNLPAGVSPTAIAAGDYYSIAIGNDGKLYAWGFNQIGQLGNGNYTSSNSPVVVNLPAGVSPTIIAAGGGHSMAIGNDGKLYAWGFNFYGQLGNGNNTSSNMPVVVNLPAGVSPTIIAAGGGHSMTIGNNGKLYAWGDNSSGQLGNGTTTQSNTPVVVNLAAGISPAAIAAGDSHSLAIGNDGKLYTWGYNYYGQLGNGTTTQSNTPVAISLPAGVSPIAIAANSDHSMVSVSPYSLGINNVSQVEGNSGTTNFTFTVSLFYSSSQTVTVDYATNDGTATAPTDYTATNGTLIFSPGITTQNIVVPVNGDTNIEDNETFTVNLSNPTGATLTSTPGIGTIINDDGIVTTTTTLVSNPNPSTVGQPVIFTATLNPMAATGTVTFIEGATILGTAPVVSGTAVYTNASLIVGSHVISATYDGTAIYTAAASQPITQVVVAACAPLVVTAVTDDGTGTHCGTLSYALSQPITGSTPVTVTFALTQGNTITFTGSLTTTAKVKAGVTIYGGAFGSSNRVILNGNGVAGDGLHLAGNNRLVNLTIEHFGAKELVLEGTGNRMQGVVVIAS